MRRSCIVFTLKCVLAAALIWWLIASGRLEWRVLSGVRVGCAFVGLLASRAIGLIFPLIRWQRLVLALGLKLTVAELIQIGLIGNFFALVAPASLGQDGARLYYGTRANEGQAHELVSSILMDRIIGMLTIMLMGAISGTTYVVLNPQAGLGLSVGVIAAVLILSTAVFSILLWRAPQLLKIVGCWKSVHRVMASVARYRDRRRALAGAVALSCAAQITVIAAAWFGFATLGLFPPGVAVFAVTPFVSASNAIPLTPMGVGISDSIGELLYQYIGIDGGAESSLTVRFGALLVSLACGLGAFLAPVFRARRARVTADAQPAVRQAP